MLNEATSTSLYVPKRGERVRFLERSPYSSREWGEPGEEYVINSATESHGHSGWVSCLFEGKSHDILCRVEPTAPKREDLCDACAVCGAQACDSEYGNKHAGGFIGTAFPGEEIRLCSAHWGSEYEGAIDAKGAKRIAAIKARRAASEERRFYGTMPSVLPATLPAGTAFKFGGNFHFPAGANLEDGGYVGPYSNSSGPIAGGGAGMCMPKQIDWSTVPIAPIPTGEGKRCNPESFICAEHGERPCRKPDPYREHADAFMRKGQPAMAERLAWEQKQDAIHARKLQQAKDQLDAPIRTQHDGHGYRRTVSHATFAPPAWPEDSEHEGMV